MSFVAGVFFGLIFIAAIAIIKWDGIWRVLAAIPLVGIVAVAINIYVDVRANPTSHNLWPFELIIWGGSGFLVLLILAGLRYLFQKFAENKKNYDS